jgi:hypothetical protein
MLIMEELRIKTRTIDVYETSDGREFESEYEAQSWQQHLENIKDVIMLDSNFCNTTDVGSTIYVYIKTWEQLDAFNVLQAYEGIEPSVTELGYWYYDGSSYSYKNVETEMILFQFIIEALNAARE